MSWIEDKELSEEARADIARREKILAQYARDPRKIERGDGGAAPSNVTPLHDWRNPQESARRAVDAAHTIGELNATQADKLDRLVRRDKQGVDANYIAAIADPDYASAFAKLLSLGVQGRPELAPVHLNDAEREAFHRVTLAAGTLNIGTPGDGGYAVPVALDPTVLPSSGGTINPWRELARSITIAGSNVWKGVSSDGISANFEAELSEVTESKPDLVQPEIKVEKAHAFLPFSIEVGEDWAAIREDLLRMLQAAKDELEAYKFLYGTGSLEPAGILYGLVEKETASSGALAVDDLYTVKADLGPRFQPRAKWTMCGSMRDQISRLIGHADPTEPQLFDEAGNLLRRPVVEVPDMSDAVFAGERIAIYGDFKAAFGVVDRTGLRVELIPHLMSPFNNLPTGQRGLYAWWRVGSGVLVDNAARTLIVKA